jgi:hypothetical protein
MMMIGVVGLGALAFSACQPGWINPLAGTGQAGSTGDGGPAVDATFQQPGHIVYEQSTGAYYVVDGGACVIRKVAPGGTISTVAGNGTCGYSGDGGPATEAQINPVSGGLGGGIAQDAAGNLYLADSSNNALRKIATDDSISTVASGTSFLTDVEVSTTGTLYAALPLEGVFSVSADGTLTRASTITGYTALAADPSGGIFAACTGLLVACAGSSSPTVDHLDEGSTTPTVVASPVTNGVLSDLSVDAAGNLYAVITDSSLAAGVNVLRIDPDGTVTTIAGNGTADPGTGAQYGNALDLALSPVGVAATENNGLLVSSGHVVYRLDHPSTAGPLLSPGGCYLSRFYPGVDLSGQNLSGVDFADCDLTGANLASTNLEGADLSGATVDGLKSGSVTGTPAALPTGWVLKSGWLIGPGADLSGAIILGGDFSGVDFTGVDLSGTGFGLGPNLSGADLSGAVLTAPPIGFVGVDLSGANLSGLDLSTSTLSGSTLTGANIDDTDLSGATLDGVISGGLIGTPSALPPGWTLVDGTLIPPPAT